MKNRLPSLQKRLLAYSFTFLLYGLSFAQTAALQVLSVNGDFSETPQLSISWTVGQISINTQSNTSCITTQGFQQSFILEEADKTQNAYQDQDTEITPSELLKTNISEDFKMQFFPNPVSNQLTVKFDNPIKEAIQIQVHDLRGGLLQTHSIFAGQQKLNIGFSDLPEGVYFLSLQNATNHLMLSSCRIVKSDL